MTQPDHFYFAVTINCVADPHHWIGEINEPCIGTSLLHVAEDFHQRHDVARRVDESAGTAILGVRLMYAIFQGDIVIRLPQFFARTNLNSRDHKICTIECIFMISMGADGEIRIPFFVEPVRKPMDNVKALRIAVNQRKM